MSNYTLSTDFTAKDSLISGNPAKLVKGSEISSEFNAVATAIASKVDKTSATGSAQIPAGTQAQRDGSPAAGYVRFNSSSGAFEGFDGTQWGPLGSNNGPVADVLTYTATAAQTVFILSMAYTPGQRQVEVFVNGLLMSLTTDYVETDYQTITFNSGLTVGDEVVFRVWRVDTLVDGDAANMSYLPAGTSAVATTVQTKLRESVSVKDFGAVGDGVTDDTTALQNAIDYAKSIGASLDFGGSQYTYKITTALTGGSNLQIIGSGATINIASISSGEKTGIVFAGSAGTGVAITSGATELSFTVNVADTSSFAVGDYVQVASGDSYTYGSGAYNVAKGEFHRIRSIVANTSVTFTTPLVDTYSTTPKLYPITWVSDVSVKGIKIVGLDTPATAQRGIALRYVKNFDISENEFSAQDYYQVECASSIIGRINSNRFTGVYYDGVTGTIFYGISVMDGSQWIDVGGNIGNKVRHLVITTSRTSGQGFYGQPMFINVHNNISYDSMAGGGGRSYAFEQHGFGRFNIWNANQAHGCYSGIRVEGGSDISVTNNLFTAYAYQGIILGRSDANMSNILVSGNVVDNYTGEVTAGSPCGLRLDICLTMENITVEGNTFTKTAKSNNGVAFSLAGGSTASRNIVFRNNTGSAGTSESTGYAVSTTATVVASFEGNHFYGWRGGYSITNGAKVQVEGGSVRNFSAGATGFGLYSNADRTIFKNVHLENINTGIRLDTLSTNCLATLNTMTSVTTTTPSNAGTSNTTTGNYVV